MQRNHIIFCFPVFFYKEKTRLTKNKNVEKSSHILQRSCGVSTASFLKYVWPVFNIMHETVNCKLERLLLNSSFAVLNLR